MDRARSHRWQFALVVALLLTATLWLQWRSGALEAELSGYPDEAAHYVTSLMFQQYVVQGAPSNPLAFSEDYYLHYPKVAIGHWPPAYYAVAGSWMLGVGTSARSVLFLQALFAVAIAGALFLALTNRIGPWLSAAVAMIWILLPVTAQAYSMIMSELLLTLASLLAAVSFASYLANGRHRDLYVYGVWTVAAIMTKGSGFALLSVPLIAAVFSDRMRIFKDPKFYLTMGACLVVVAPWTILTAKMVANGADLRGLSVEVALEQLRVALRQFVPILTPVVATFFAVGLTAFLLKRYPFLDREFWSSQLALLLATYVLHVLSPSGMEPRRVLMAIPSLVALAGLGLAATVSLLSVRNRWIPAVASALLLSSVFFSVALLRKPPLGWRSFIEEQLPDYVSQNIAILTAGGVLAENILISEVAQMQPAWRAHIVRSSKLLADSDWSGMDYKKRVASLDEAGKALASIPVNVVVVQDPPQGLSIDSTGSQWHWLAVADICKHTEEWTEVASAPILNESGMPSHLRLYERIQPVKQSPKVSVDLKRMLGRVLESR